MAQKPADMVAPIKGADQPADKGAAKAPEQISTEVGTCALLVCFAYRAPLALAYQM